MARHLIKIKRDGAEYEGEATDLATLFAQMSALSGDSEEHRGPGRPPKLPKDRAAEKAKAKRDAETRERGVAILKTIKKEGKDGAKARDLAAAIGIPDDQLRGMGGHVSRTKNAVADLEIEWSEVVRTKRGSDGRTLWIAGPRIGEAIRALEKGA